MKQLVSNAVDASLFFFFLRLLFCFCRRSRMFLTSSSLLIYGES